MLVGHPQADGAQIVAEMDVASGLYARQDPGHGVIVCAAAVAPAGIVTAMPYEVQTPVFEGPFDLLLHLILRSQLDVYEISLSAIVDVYVASLALMTGVDLDIATEFLLIAATLIELKTKGLLPGRDDVELDEEFALWEERDLLLSRLLECKTFKDASAALQRLASVAERSYPRTAGLEERYLDVAPDLLAGLTTASLRAAMLAALAPKPVVRIDLDHVAPVRISVADAVAELLDELPRVGRISFRRLTQELVERLEVIVRFLAVLELYKQGFVELEQVRTFGELTIVWLGAPSALDEVGISLVDTYEG
jgi:segregation and condensation protein A